jgi:hypothetical protein
MVIGEAKGDVKGDVKAVLFDDLVKSRHSGENRSPDVVPAKAGSHLIYLIPIFIGNPAKSGTFAGMTIISLFRLFTTSS